MTAHIISPDHIHIVFDDGKSATIYKSQPLFNQMVHVVRQKLWNEAYNIAFPAEEIAKKISNKSDAKSITKQVKVEHGIISYGGVPVHGTLVDRMLSMIDQDFDVEYMGMFLENLMQNTSYRAVNELYGFLEKSNLPLTEDGCFLAYKRVRNNFKDLHSGKFDNSPGQIVKMTRRDVNEDKHKTCSAGLHFCAHSYLSSYGNSSGNRTIMVKIDPRDVVSIPVDYNNAKGRCCRYTVVCEIKKEKDSAMPIKSARIENKQILIVAPGAVQQIDPNNDVVMITHESLKAASAATGIPTGAIRRVCNGKRNTTGGFKWRWTEFAPKPIDADDAYAEEEDENQSGWKEIF